MGKKIIKISDGREVSLSEYFITELDIVLNKAIPNKWDCMALFIGREGVGKSTLAMQAATYLDHTFCLDRCVFTPQQFVEACTNAEPEQSIVWDEAITGANVQKHASETSQTIISMLTQIRKKKLKIMLCFPYLYMLNKYFVSRCLFGCYVYAKGFDKRGQGHFYHQGQMERTYNLMKEKYRYSPNYAFRASGKSFSLEFGNKLCLDEEAYDQKKTESIMSLVKNDKDNLWKNKTLKLAEYMNKELGVTHKTMAEILKVSRVSITNMLNVS